MSPGRKYFNIRVYGILLHDGKILLSDELIHGKEITKLPGGGLEFGESTLDCVKREFLEELNIAIEVKEHFYTTDFYVNSAFNPMAQVISIYYLVKTTHPELIPTSHRTFDFAEKKEGAQSFRWKALEKISENDFTFAIDRKVAGLLQKQFTIL